MEFESLVEENEF